MKSTRTKVSFYRLDAPTHKALELMAAKDKRSEAQLVELAVEEYFTRHFMDNSFERVVYTGEPTMTRGEYGENVQAGRVSPDGEVFVWDSTFGWSSWGAIVRSDGSSDWKRTGQMVEAVHAQY